MKKLSIFSILILAIVITMGASSSSNNAGTEALGGHFKNLKVLPKDISKDELDSVMDGFTIALNVRCGFCHARKKDTTQRGLDFASDEKDEKNIARDMLRMVNSLNQNNFNFNHSNKPDTIHTIVCYTCHRGAKQPDFAHLLPDIQKIEAEREQEWKKAHGVK